MCTLFLEISKMNQKQKPRLYFTNDFSPENVKKLQGQGWTLRRASAYRPGDSLEECSEVSGDVPQAYLDTEKKANGKLTVQLDVETSPALQKALDDAKAECEKVAAKNAELKEQLDKEREAVKRLTAENTELQNKVLIAEKTLVSADEEIKALKDRITYLQEPLASGGASAGTPAEAKPKKPTAAELKAAKAAEDAAQANETKE